MRGARLRVSKEYPFVARHAGDSITGGDLHRGARGRRLGRITSVALWNDCVAATMTSACRRSTLRRRARMHASYRHPRHTPSSVATATAVTSDRELGIRHLAHRGEAPRGERRGRADDRRSPRGGMPRPGPRFLTPAAPATSAPLTRRTTPRAAAGHVTTTREDGATRTVTTTYDAFALAPVTVKTDATNGDGTTLPRCTPP